MLPPDVICTKFDFGPHTPSWSLDLMGPISKEKGGREGKGGRGEGKGGKEYGRGMEREGGRREGKVASWLLGD